MVLDPHTRLEALIDKIEPEFQAGFLRLVSSIKDDLLLSEVADLISQGRVLEALQSIEQNISVFADGIIAGFVTSGVSTAGAVGDLIDEVVSFNQVNPFVVDYMQNNRARVIAGLTQQQQAATTRAITSGVLAGQNPLDQARNVVNSIGLTELQVGHVERYRVLLMSLDADALDRNLRDQRFDPTLRRAIRTNTPLTPAQIDRMVERYRSRALAHRARVIARTEALPAVHAGSHQAYLQMVLSGLLMETDLERVWHTAGDSRVRHSHTSMSGQVRGLNEPFITGAGASLMFPGDPSGGASEIISCRCAVATRINRELLEGQ